jgi:transposase
MARGYRPVDRDQVFLFPPDMREWLPQDHLVWFVLRVVDELDTAAFMVRVPRRAQRAVRSRAGRAGYDPRMLLALLVYGYACGQRSSRQIERLCHTDVAYRIVCAQDVPDHCVIARFRQGYEQPLGDLFGQVLEVCARAGMGRLGSVALDGTKIAANASLQANRTESRLRTLAGQIIAEAGAVDAGEDEQFGPECRGDELPPLLADSGTRTAAIRDALASIEADRAADAIPVVERAGKAQRNLRRTRAHLEQVWARRDAAAAQGRALPGPRPPSLEADRRYMRAQAVAEHAQGHAANSLASPAPGEAREKKRNLTDIDSRIMKTRTGWIQGYNGQLVVSSDHLIIAADLSNNPGDVTAYQPMITAAEAAAAQMSAAAGRQLNIGCVLADAGYASNANLTADGPDRLIALDTRRTLTAAAADNPASGDPPDDADPWRRMDHRLRTPDGAAHYKHRAGTVEPVNAHLKDRRGLRRFSRRGLNAARSEFRFAAAVTNLMRLRTTTA